MRMTRGVALATAAVAMAGGTFAAVTATSGAYAAGTCPSTHPNVFEALINEYEYTQKERLRLSATKTTPSTCVYDGVRMYYNTFPEPDEVRTAGGVEHRIPTPPTPPSPRPARF